VRQLRSLWARLARRHSAAAVPPNHDSLSEPVDLAGFAQLERKLDTWARWGRRGESTESDEQLAVVVPRVANEVERFFGQNGLRHVEPASGKSGGTMLFAADRLFVAFLGRRAAMAVTRKLYSDLS
jgi:hypothetical protein